MRSSSPVHPFYILTLILQLFITTAQAEEISFLGAWERVQKINNVLAAEQANVQKSKFIQEAAKSLYLPQIELVGSYTRLDKAVQLDTLDSNPLSGLRDSTFGQSFITALGGESAFSIDITKRSFGRAGVGMIWPIYTGGRITAAQEISAAQTDVALQLQETQRRSVFEDFVNVYFGVVLAKKNLTIHKQAEAGLQQHLKDARALEKQGQIALVQRLSVQAALERAMVASKKSRRQLEAAQIMLQEFLHQDAPIEPADKLFISKGLPPVDRFLAKTLNNNPALKMLDAKKGETHAVIKAEKGRYHPELFLFADYTALEDHSLASELAPDWMVGIGMSLTLMSRVSRSKTISAVKQEQTAITQLALATRRMLKVAVQVSHKETEQTLQEYIGLDSSLKLAEEVLRIRQKSFEQGFSTSVELIDAQLFLAEIQTAQSLAAYDYLTSLARLLSLSGETQSFTEYQNNARQGIGQQGSAS